MSSTNDTNLFRSLLSLCTGAELSVHFENRLSLSSLARGLGNSELFWFVEGQFGDPSVLTVDSAVSRYIAKKTFDGDRREESEFIASRFSEIPRFF
jgi:hypothetical protein